VAGQRKRQEIAMSEETKVMAVKIKIGDVTVEMTFKQAKELHEMLADLFGRDVRVIQDILPVPYYPYHSPYHWGGWTVTYGDTHTGTSTAFYSVR